jgi:hypothetical protein
MSKFLENLDRYLETLSDRSRKLLLVICHLQEQCKKSQNEFNDIDNAIEESKKEDDESVCSSDDVIDETEMQEFIKLHESAAASAACTISAGDASVC